MAVLVGAEKVSRRDKSGFRAGREGKVGAERVLRLSFKKALTPGPREAKVRNIMVCCARLSEMLPGETAVVSAFAEETPQACRLMEMGLLPGTEVALIRRAPLGDPLEVRVRGSLLSLRRAEAALIQVAVAHGVA